MLSNTELNCKIIYQNTTRRRAYRGPMRYHEIEATDQPQKIDCSRHVRERVTHREIASLGLRYPYNSDAKLSSPHGLKQENGRVSFTPHQAKVQLLHIYFKHKNKGQCYLQLPQK